MRKLHFTHSKTLDFDVPVIDHSFSLRLEPHTDSRQIICDLRKRVLPTEHLTEVTDEWGTTMCVGDCYAPHTHFSYSVSGIAWMKDTPYTEGPLHPAYRYPSELTHPGDAVRQLYAQGHRSSGSPMERAEAWMHFIYQQMTYEKGVTTVQTTAEQAAVLRRGVCQDFAHLMLALCRLDGIPARYIVGYLYGEGETHAWVEIYDGTRWGGLDPTNDCLIDSRYITLTRGRDYNDCILDKGFFRTFGSQSQKVQQTQHVHVIVQDM